MKSKFMLLSDDSFNTPKKGNRLSKLLSFSHPPDADCIAGAAAANSDLS